MAFSEEAGEAVVNGSVDPVEEGDIGFRDPVTDGSPKRWAMFDEGSGVGEGADVRGKMDVEAGVPGRKGERTQLLWGECAAGAKNLINRLEGSRFYKLRVGQNESAGHNTRVVGGAVADDGGDDGPSWLECTGRWEKLNHGAYGLG